MHATGQLHADDPGKAHDPEPSAKAAAFYHYQVLRSILIGNPVCLHIDAIDCCWWWSSISHARPCENSLWIAKRYCTSSYVFFRFANISIDILPDANVIDLALTAKYLQLAAERGEVMFFSELINLMLMVFKAPPALRTTMQRNWRKEKELPRTGWKQSSGTKRL